jgi:hypothetical protein
MKASRVVIVPLVAALVCAEVASGQGDAEECAKRGAIGASLATIESAAAAATRTEQKAALLAQMADIEKRISDLQPIMSGSCPDDLGIAALSDRLKRVHGPIDQAVKAEVASGQQASTQEDAEECAKRSAIGASLAKIESAAAAATETKHQAALLAQMADIEKRISELQPVMHGGCLDDLGIAALSGRLKRVQAPIQQAVKVERRRQEINAKPWPETIKQAVLAKRVVIGMTTEQVTAAWGRPTSIDETITRTVRHEQWIYPGETYLYFTNGVLETVQRRR